MNKLMLEIYLPAAHTSFDVRFPSDIRLAELLGLAAGAISQLSGGLYDADGNAVLCDRKSGAILNINMTPWELGLRNGSQLMLI